MADVVISPNMGLPVPITGQTPGPAWANDVVACLSVLDQHNHSSGSGVPITPSGININAALPFNNNSAISIASAAFTPQASITALNAIYFKGVDLYINDGSGNTIQVTSGGQVNATSSGISNGTNTASFVSSVLVVNASSTTPADVQCASILLGNNIANSKYLTLAPPSAMAANYQLTLPSIPGSTMFVTLDSSGNFGTATGISASQIATASIAGSQLQNSTITGTQIASNINLPGNTVQENGRNVVVSNTNTTTSLCIVRGVVSSGGIISGEGFTVSSGGTGISNITFTTPFSDIPAIVVAAADAFGQTVAQLSGLQNSSSCQVETFLGGSLTNAIFSIIAIGQR